MKNAFLKLFTLVLFSASAVAILGITINIGYDHFKFSAEGEHLLIMIGDFNLATILFGILITQFIGILMMMIDMTADVEARELMSDPNVLDQL